MRDTNLAKPLQFPTPTPVESAFETPYPFIDPTLRGLWAQVLGMFDWCEFETQAWLAPTALLELTDGQAVVGVNNVFSRDYLQAHHQAELEMALTSVLARPVTITLIVSKLMNRADMQRAMHRDEVTP